MEHVTTRKVKGQDSRNISDQTPSTASMELDECRHLNQTEFRIPIQKDDRDGDSIVSSNQYNSSRVSESRSTDSNQQELPDVQTESRIANGLQGLMDIFENKMDKNEAKQLQQYNDTNKKQEKLM